MTSIDIFTLMDELLEEYREEIDDEMYPDYETLLDNVNEDE